MSSERIELRDPTHPVQRRAIYWWMLQSGVLYVSLMVAGAVAWNFWEAGRTWIGVALIVVTVLLIAGVAVEPFWRFRVHRWETTDHAVYARTGWLVREWRAAPLSRVQTVDAVQGPLEQLLGLSTLRVTTAPSGGAIDIVGLDAATATREADRLARATELTPGDAT